MRHHKNKQSLRKKQAEAAYKGLTEEESKPEPKKDEDEDQAKPPKPKPE